MSGRVRVYLPSTAGRLRDALRSADLGPAPLAAHAVTDAVRAELSDSGEEEWEYAASAAAAQASVRLLGPDEPARRLVLALDVPTVRDGDPDDPTAVEVPDAVPLHGLAAVLADARDAEPTVARARASGDPEDLEACLEHELGWWAAQELDQLLEDLLDPTRRELGADGEV